MTTRTIVLVPSLLLALVAACSSGDDTAPPPSGPASTPFDAPLLKASTTLCDQLAACSPLFYGIYFDGDHARCVERERSTVLAGLLQPGVQVTPSSLNACADEGATAGCDGLFRLLAANTTPSSCMVPGGVADGAACAYPLQCASGNCDRGDPTTRCGVCAPRNPAGGTCRDDNGCAYGHACVAKTCVPFGESGAACDAKHPCLATLRCDGTCKPMLGEGAPCKSLTGECDLYAGGLVCVAGTCTKATLAKAGEDCGVVDGKAIACAAGACKPSLIKGTCFANAKDGEPCDELHGADCEFHAACIDGKCVSLFEQSCK